MRVRGWKVAPIDLPIHVNRMLFYLDLHHRAILHRLTIAAARRRADRQHNMSDLRSMGVRNEFIVLKWMQLSLCPTETAFG